MTALGDGRLLQLQTMVNPLLLSDVQTCRRCVTLGKDHVPASGAVPARVLILGQSPGAEEVQQGIPFVGACGEMIDFMLDAAELSREEVYITNTLKCRPPSNRPGSPAEIRNCRDQWLKHEIAQVRPKVILTLGRDAFTALCLPEPFAHKRVIPSSAKDRFVLVSYHPGYFLRRGALEEFVAVGTLLKELLSNDQSDAGVS